jgi:hypothetical protein
MKWQYLGSVACRDMESFQHKKIVLYSSRIASTMVEDVEENLLVVTLGPTDKYCLIHKALV